MKTIGYIASAHTWTPANTFPHSWYDATLGVTDAGSGAVSAWADQSGNGRTASQGTAGDRPVTGTRTINSLNAIDFISNDFLSSASFTLAQPFTLLVVAKSDISTVAIMLGQAGAAGSGIVQVAIGGTNCWQMHAGSTLGNTTTADTNTYSWACVFNGASSVMYRSGAVLYSGATTGTNSLQGGLRIGDRNGSGGGWDGLIGEVVLVNSAMTATEVGLWNNYCKAKWATP